VAGEREHRGGADARAGPGRPAEEEAQGGDPAGQGPAARHCAPDLVRRDFPAQKINQKWYGDHTEISTDEGKLHLASVLDVGSRRVLGFALSEHHDARNAYGALAMAVAVRGGAVPGVIMHTDYAEVGVKPGNLGMAWSGSPAEGFPGLTFLVYRRL